MKEALPKLKLGTLKVSHNATSSPESAGGHSRYSLQESVTEQDSGQEAPRANHSVLPENNSDSLTRDTSRLSSSTSSVSATLQSSLGNRLRQQLQNRGCAIYKLTWKERATPSGLPYSQLVASALRTKETDFSSARIDWPTPAVSLITNDVNMRSTDGRTKPNKLGWAAAMAAWPTPTTRDHKDGQECLNVPINSLLGRQVWIAAWTTPMEDDKRESTAVRPSRTLANEYLRRQVQAVSGVQEPIRITASGQMLTGSDAGMESSGQLNPAHSRWLMGFPPEWDDCAVMAMQSFRKSLPNSSQLSWAPLKMRLRAKK